MISRRLSISLLNAAVAAAVSFDHSNAFTGQLVLSSETRDICCAITHDEDGYHAEAYLSGAYAGEAPVVEVSWLGSSGPDSREVYRLPAPHADRQRLVSTRESLPHGTTGVRMSIIDAQGAVGDVFEDFIFEDEIGHDLLIASLDDFPHLKSKGDSPQAAPLMMAASLPLVIQAPSSQVPSIQHEAHIDTEETPMAQISPKDSPHPVHHRRGPAKAEQPQDEEDLRAALGQTKASAPTGVPHEAQGTVDESDYRIACASAGVFGAVAVASTGYIGFKKKGKKAEVINSQELDFFYEEDLFIQESLYEKGGILSKSSGAMGNTPGEAYGIPDGFC